MKKVIFVRSWEKTPHRTASHHLKNGVYISEGEGSAFEEQVYVNLFNQNEWDLQWCGITQILDHDETRKFLEDGCVIFICINNAFAFIKDLRYLKKIRRTYPQCKVIGLTHWNEVFTIYPEKSYLIDNQELVDHPQNSKFYRNFDGLVIPSSSDVGNIFSMIFDKPVFSCLPPISLEYVNSCRSAMIDTCAVQLAPNTIVFPRLQGFSEGLNDSTSAIYTILAETDYNVYLFTIDHQRDYIRKKRFYDQIAKEPRITIGPKTSYGDYLNILSQSVAAINYTNWSTWLRSALDSFMAETPHIGSPGIFQNWLFPDTTVPYSMNNLIDLLDITTSAIKNQKKLLFNARQSLQKNACSNSAQQFDIFLSNIG